MTTESCRRPGCDGTIGDGYCDTCGMAPANTANTAAATAPPEPEATAATARPEPTAAAARPEPEATAAAARLAPEATAAAQRDPESTTASGPATSAATGGFSGGTRSSRRTRSTRTERKLGSGLVDVPEVAVGDPAAALKTNPQVPERSRFCASCGAKVGRASEGRPARTEGFCSRCRTPYSFLPALPAGTLVAGQYDVRGALAHGGNGWVYLAIDRNVENRWVVLKGLIHTNDPDARAAAIAERRFLAHLDHPNIVNIYNFVEHPGADGTSAGYIVMEYVGGRSLLQLLEDRRGPDRKVDPLPVDQAIALILEILPAFGYFHRLGLAYCDFKPDNAIQYGRRLKLIDLGAVIRMDDRTSALYGTIGYQAPEIGTIGPSVESDLYTVGRTLAVLALAMRASRDGDTAEIPSDHPVLQNNPSFERILRRSTDPNPDRRFISAEEMSDQLDHVLRETLVLSTGKPHPRPSVVFGSGRGWFATDLLVDGTTIGRPDPRRVVATLPIPVVDLDDPGAAQLATAVGATADDVAQMIKTVGTTTPELGFAHVRTLLTAGDTDGARHALAERTDADPDDWRVPWHRGLVALAEGDCASAVTAFDECYTALPGESVVKLALAAAAECAERDDTAERYYALVARSDPSVSDAAFGWARTLLRSGNRTGAIAALDLVPETSGRFVDAQLAAIRTMLGDRHTVQRDVLYEAAARADRLTLDPATEQQVRVDLFEAAVAQADNAPSTGEPLLNIDWSKRDLRFALEESLRSCARLTTDPDRRYALIDRANDVRPRTWT